MKRRLFAIPFVLLVAMLALVLALSSCDDKTDGPTVDGCTHEGMKAVAASAPTCKATGVKAHWSCPDCGKKFSDAAGTTEITEISVPKVEHEYDDLGFCIYCLAPFDPTPVGTTKPPLFTGEKTNLTFMLTDNSNGKELSSGLRRYLAGDTDNVDDTGDIDGYVARRNGFAEKYANCTVVYDYYSDGDATDNWGQVGTKMETLAKSVNSPDMFSNFIYDMVNCQLLGCWKNLLNTTDYGTNHFSFKEDGYTDTGRGYMFEYMKSLSLRPAEQLYLVASDYFTDLVRSFLIVPVSNRMMDNIQTGEAEFNKDRDGNGDFDVKDFYMLIAENKWTYNMLAQYAQEVTKGATNISLATSNVGFALSTTSGLAPSGLLYTTSVKIINREWNDAKNDYDYYYPETNQDLITFCDNLTNLFTNVNGVIAVTDSHLAIRERFITNNVLFGGIVCLGSLEDVEYDEMKGEGEGFSVVPVPLYREGSEDNYLTAIHNLGKVGAISAKSAKFSVCTAFLEYQSTHSTKILNTYYNDTLKYDVAGGTEEAVAMLDYIRANVRSSFDKVYEDAIGFYTNADEDKWHIMILRADYKFTGSEMNTKYGELQSTKQDKLINTLYAAYDNLPK